jgi:hypothetical protein
MTRGQVFLEEGRQAGIRVLFFVIAVLGALVSGMSQAAPQQIGVGELDRLIADHLPKHALPDSTPLDVLDRDFDLGPSVGTVNFSIPGFKAYGCDACHQGQGLLNKAAHRMQAVLIRFKTEFPEIPTVPLKQYIVQPWADELLQPRQFAHTTFDTIRIFPRTILVDSRVYGNATHLHETLHLTQEFVGPPNELEAYGLNIRSDPRFLLLNYPYFKDAVTAFFLPELPRILQDYFARPVKETLNVSNEVQWFMNAFDLKDIQSVAGAVKKMEPLLREVTELLKEHPIRTSYWSEQTGNVAFPLEIAAIKRLPLPALDVSKDTLKKAMAIIDKQMSKTDNLRLGYVIDRKKESLLTIKYQLKLDDPLTRLNLYFHYLKGRFVGPGGEVRLVVDNQKDLIDFTNKKLKGISKMAQSGDLSVVEKKGADQLIETIKLKLKDL